MTLDAVAARAARYARVRPGTVGAEQAWAYSWGGGRVRPRAAGGQARSRGP